MKLYHISELEQLSGIKAPTIRIWERRYNLIQPGRTETNIRMYDDRQVRKLLNVATLLNNGYKISKIAELDEEDIHAMVLGLQNSGSETDETAIAFINRLVVAMLDFDEVNFEITYTAAIKRYGLFDAMLQVFYPLLQKIGIMWTTEDVTPVQEHFASAVMRRKLMAATDALEIKKKRRKKFLLLLPPGEWHEIGLLFANYIIRSKDIETIYLGQNVPYEQVAAVLEKTKISHVLLFLITRREQIDIAFLRKSMQLPNDLLLLIACSAAVTGILQRTASTHFLQSPFDLLQHL
ncbi:regulatory protein MerR [Niastella koreensis GR20-10]|uniref:Regulatory protein MerR n=2 Tax=Niastella koreensis TaxID=354356 RepID=G8TKH3_NIAKG|nr:MerR family transcriptional regulator [Niastella koreensis]AEV97629.1 regulatory protein MerR [Niastella koreensis GR20-10]